MENSYIRLMDRLYLASIWIAGVAIILMSLIIPWGVFTRYLLGTGSQWPEPIAILLMMVFTFIGAAASYRAGAHIAVEMFTIMMPPALRKASAGLVHLLMAVVSLFVAWYGTRLCLQTWGQSVVELPWLPVGATYAPLPIGSALTLLFVIENVVFGSQAKRRLMRFEEETDENDETLEGVR